MTDWEPFEFCENAKLVNFESVVGDVPGNIVGVFFVILLGLC